MSKPWHSKILEGVLKNIQNHFEAYQALFFIILSIVLCIIIRYLIKAGFDTFLAKRKTPKSLWHRMIISALYQPVLSMVWIVLATLILAFSLPFFAIAQQGWLFYDILKSAFILSILWFGMRLIREFSGYKLTQAKSQEAPGDISGIYAIAKLSQVMLILLGSLFILPLLGVNIAGLLTIGGASTLIIGFAAKDTLANFFGGLMVFMDRSFAVGDWISSPDRQIEGTVEHIGWRMTKIRSFARIPIYVPNGIFSQVVVLNPSRMTNRRIRKVFGVRYDDAKVLPKILENVRTMLAEHPGISKKQIILVNITDFAPSSIEFMIYTFTKTSKWAAYLLVQDDVLLKCEQIITECGAECAFPTTTMHIPDKISVDMARDLSSRD